jgi:hypothetical protein
MPGSSRYWHTDGNAPCRTASIAVTATVPANPLRHSRSNPTPCGTAAITYYNDAGTACPASRLVGHNAN